MFHFKPTQRKHICTKSMEMPNVFYFKYPTWRNMQQQSNVTLQVMVSPTAACFTSCLVISYRSWSSTHGQASVELSIFLPDYKNTHSTALSLFHNPAGVFAVDFTLSEATGASSSGRGCERNRGGSFGVT